MNQEPPAPPMPNYSNVAGVYMINPNPPPPAPATRPAPPPQPPPSQPNVPAQVNPVAPGVVSFGAVPNAPSQAQQQPAVVSNPPPTQSHIATNLDMSALVDAVFVEVGKQTRR
jgi:hypothetical protein